MIWGAKRMFFQTSCKNSPFKIPQDSIYSYVSLFRCSTRFNPFPFPPAFIVFIPEFHPSQPLPHSRCAFPASGHKRRLWKPDPPWAPLGAGPEGCAAAAAAFWWIRDSQRWHGCDFRWPCLRWSPGADRNTGDLGVRKPTSSPSNPIDGMFNGHGLPDLQPHLRFLRLQRHIRHCQCRCRHLHRQCARRRRRRRCWRCTDHRGCGLQRLGVPGADLVHQLTQTGAEILSHGDFTPRPKGEVCCLLVMCFF